MQIQKNLSPTICPLPFLHTYVTANGSLVACCESQEEILSPVDSNFLRMWQSQKYNELRAQLLRGEKPKLCKKCWDNEDLGVLSNRQEMWSDFESGMFGGPSLSWPSNSLDGSDRYPRAIEIKTNNLCNLKCRMCHPESSHRVQEDREIISKYRKSLNWSNEVLSSHKAVEALLALGDPFFDQLEVVQYSGGEPLISDEQLKLTLALLERNPQRIHLRYATNLTNLSYRGVEYSEIWKRFKKVNVKVSIDGIDDVYNYIRVGSDFDKVIANLKKLMGFQLPNLQLSIGFTTQAYNVFQLPDFLSYFEKILPRTSITTHLLHSPQMMKIDVYPEPYRSRLIAKLQSRKDLTHLVNILAEQPPAINYWKTLLAYTNEMEEKYKIENGFQYLLNKYLGDSV